MQGDACPVLRIVEHLMGAQPLRVPVPALLPALPVAPFASLSGSLTDHLLPVSLQGASSMLPL